MYSSAVDTLLAAQNYTCKPQGNLVSQDYKLYYFTNILYYEMFRFMYYVKDENLKIHLNLVHLFIYQLPYCLELRPGCLFLSSDF